LAIARMQRALRELVIEGVETSRGFHLRLLEHADVRSGNITIQWLEAHLAELTGQPASAETVRLAAIAAALAADHDRNAPTMQAAVGAANTSAAPAHGDGWRAVARRERL